MNKPWIWFRFGSVIVTAILVFILPLFNLSQDLPGDRFIVIAVRVSWCCFHSINCLSDPSLSFACRSSNVALKELDTIHQSSIRRNGVNSHLLANEFLKVWTHSARLGSRTRVSTGRQPANSTDPGIEARKRLRLRCRNLPSSPLTISCIVLFVPGSQSEGNQLMAGSGPHSTADGTQVGLMMSALPCDSPEHHHGHSQYRLT